MANNVVIDLPDEVVEKAREQAGRRGKNLKEVVEDAISREAKGVDNNSTYIVEKEIEKESWGVSRVTLHIMRKAGRLVEGVHYKKKGKFIYYNRRKLKDYLAKSDAMQLEEKNTAPA